MNHFLAKTFSFFICLLLSNLTVEAWTSQSVLGPQKLEIGPEFYHSKRTRTGGTEQSGGFYGFYGKYERLRPWGLFWGCEGYWAYGELKGKSATGNTLRSKMHEYEVEGKLGWNVNFSICGKGVFFTPFAGYGQYWGKNDFSEPVFLPVTFQDSIEYFSLGFLTKVCVNERLSVGANFAIKWMADGTSKVTDHPFEDDAKLVMGNKMFYNVEIPIQYAFCWQERPLYGYITPFYRFRHYGSRENFPSDFFETKFNIYGLRLAITLRL